MISFYALPEVNDYSISNIFGDLGDNIQKVIGEGDIALNLGNETWVGSLDEITLKSGYWVKQSSADVLELTASPNNNDILFGSIENFPFDVNVVSPIQHMLIKGCLKTIL